VFSLKFVKSKPAFMKRIYVTDKINDISRAQNIPIQLDGVALRKGLQSIFNRDTRPAIAWTNFKTGKGNPVLLSYASLYDVADYHDTPDTSLYVEFDSSLVSCHLLAKSLEGCCYGSYDNSNVL
jgi:hypothetical protein